jgi:iron complex outermembrane receptor protein
MTGLVNPFGPSGPEGDRLLRDAQITGDLHHARASTLLADARWSRDVFELAGGPVGIAAGVEGRRETLDNEFAEAFTSGDVAGTSTDGQSLSGARTVTALFVETIMPLAKGFEVQLAARYDHYSDFGGTVNPKIALRWQPARSIVLRGSWGTGFRAPPLPDLFTPIIHGTADGIEDPLRCPVTQSDADCNGLVTELTGGNRSLKAETSTQINAGVVLAPSNGFSLTLDYWRITKSNVIGVLPEFTILSDYARFAPGRVIRGPVDPANPELPGPIDSIVLVNENLGSLRTSGVDVDVVWRSPATMSGRFTFTLNGTYVIDWAQQLDGTTYTSGVGNVDVLGPIPRWKHHATLGWDYGAWAATLGQTFQSGYRDAAGRAPEAPPRDVSSYELWDLQGRYSGWKNTTLIVGVKNLFDRAPPFTNQRSSFQVGYDPSYADPRGRAYYLQLELAFK